MSTKPLAYIPDGYTRDAYIAEFRNLYPDVRFTYRPMLTQDRAFIYHKLNKAEPKKAEAMGAQTIKKYVSDWDIVDGKGQPVPLEESQILRLQPLLMQRIYRIVMGDDGGDDDPQQSDSERDEETDREWQEMFAGSSVEVEAEEAKN